MSAAVGREKCLEEKAGLLESMLAETKKISRMLADHDLEGLNGAVAARQACIGKVDALDQRIKACGPADSGGSPAEGRLAGKIKALLGEILELDSANMMAAGEISAALMHGIKEVNAGKNMLKYQPTIKLASRFVDREG